MSYLIEYHFKRALAFLGFGECEVMWSLGCCQGDGMAFKNGRVDGDGLKKIVRERFYAKDQKYFFKYIDQGLALTIDQSGHYTHWNSMTVDVDWDQLRDFEADLPDHIYQKLEDRACELRDEVNEYVKEVSQQLEADGYAIIEGTPCESDPDIVREFKTRRFTLRISKVHDDDPDVFSGDEDSDWARIQDIISGKDTYYHLRVEVLDEDDEVIGESTLHGLTGSRETEGRSFYGERRFLIKAAIAEARSVFPKEAPVTAAKAA